MKPPAIHDPFEPLAQPMLPSVRATILATILRANGQTSLADGAEQLAAECREMEARLPDGRQDSALRAALRARQIAWAQAARMGLFKVYSSGGEGAP